MTSFAGTSQKHPSSYRDPSGYVFLHGGEIFRQINQSFKIDFDFFISSGLYEKLVKEKLLIPHQVVSENLTGDDTHYTTIKPEKISFISFLYEWPFSMLKEAALLTLQLALIALDYGMILKDASPYNVQFHEGKLIFIDSLSFEKYTDGEPWIAYRQFCENFVAPLALMHDRSLPMQPLLLAFPEGIPLSYAKSLLSFKSRFNLLLYLHIHLHASYASKPGGVEKKTSLSKSKLVSLLKGLQSLISSFSFEKFENVWGNYYIEAETRPNYLTEKKGVITDWLSSLPMIDTVLDAGGNRGEFSKLAAQFARQVICADGEHFAVNDFYEEIRSSGTTNILPLCVDFTNPTPAIGVNNEERASFFERTDVELVMGLALLHHLCIGRNMSFEIAARMFAKLGRFLLIEFVAKEDDKVKILLAQKKDIYSWYGQPQFEQAFSTRFRLLKKQALSSAPRTLYLMERL